MTNPTTPANSAVAKAKETALEQKKPLTIQEMIESSTKALGRALPAHMRPERMVRIALTTLRMNPKLYTCDPQSFLGALFQCAQLGLEPNIEGQAYIIPYNTSVKTPTGWEKKLVAQFQIGYKGFVELFWRHQSSLSLTMETIHKNDHFMCDLGSNELSHKLPPFGEERGEVVGYYAKASLKGGGTSFKVMSKDEAMKFAKKFTKCWDTQKKTFMDGTPWADHFDAMAMKTVLKQLMKLLPKSIEIQHALAMDETVKFNVDKDMVDVPPAEIEHTSAPEVGSVIEAPALPENGVKKLVSAVDVKIHQAKKDLGDKKYYEILGDMGAEHMAELSDLDKEVLLKQLQDAIKEARIKP